MVRHPVKLILLLTCFFQAIGVSAKEPAPFEGRLRIATEHFVIIFEPEERAAANYVASIVEEAYTLVTSSYGSYPDTIYCVLNGRSDLYYSAYAPLPAHIRLSVHGPTWPMFGPRSGDWLKIVLIHELTHNVQLTYTSGIFHALSMVFGQGLNAVPGTLLPNWAVEGPAVLFETFFTGGGRGDSNHFEMLSIAAAGDFFSYSQAGSSTVFEPSGRSYVAGYLMSEYIHRVYGDEALKDIHKKFLNFPFFGPGLAIKKVTGRSVREIFAAVVKEVKERAAATRSKTSAPTITPEVYGSYYLPQKTSRGWITYRHTHDLPAALVLFDPGTGDEEILQIVGLTDPSSFAADPTGDTVAYSSRISSKGRAGYEVFSDLFLLNIEDPSVSRITHNERLWHPAINPHSGEIVAVAGIGPESCLVAIDRKSGSIRTIFKKSGSTVYNPVFSDDGKKLFFTMNEGGMQDIWALPYPIPTQQFTPSSTAEEVNPKLALAVTGPDRSAEFFPRFSDGHIIYASDKGGALAVYSQPAAGGRGVMIAEDPVGAYAGLVDDGEVVYATYTSGGYALKRAPLPGFAAAARIASKTASSVESISIAEIPPIADGDSGVVKTGDAPLFNEKTYVDIPRLLFWLPLPVSYDPFNDLVIGPGAGAYVSASSILGANNLTAFVTYDWTELQPAFDIRGSIGIGLASLYYNAYYGYNQTEEGFFLQNLSTRLSVTRPFIYVSRYPWTNQLTAGAAMGYDTATAHLDTFGFLSKPEGAAVSNLLQPVGSIVYTAAQSGARKDFYNPFLLSAWMNIGVAAPLELLDSTTVWLGSGAKVQVKSPIKHHVVGIGIDAVYTPQSGGIAPRPLPRSGLLPMPEEGNLSLLAGLDYRFHIALLDLPLPYGYSLSHLAGGIYVESSLLADASSLTIDKYIYPGFELITRFGMVGHFPLGIGVGFRIDPRGQTAFTLLTDTRIYLTAGTGGFSPFLDHVRRAGYPGAR
jgi:hypothetical protein